MDLFVNFAKFGKLQIVVKPMELIIKTDAAIAAACGKNLTPIRFCQNRGKKNKSWPWGAVLF